MPTTDPIEILLAHNRWATRNVLAACESLSAEQFHQQFEIGPGSLHDTLAHLLGAMRRWGDFLAGREPGPRLEETRRGVPEMLALLDELGRDLDASAKAHPAEGLVTGSRGGQSYTFARAAVLMHVTTHGMHHRAQCLNMLRRLGVDPLPHSSVADWTMMADGQR